MSENDNEARFCAGCGSEIRQISASTTASLPSIESLKSIVEPSPSKEAIPKKEAPVLDSLSARTKSEMNYMNIFARHQKEQATKTAFARKLFPIRKKPSE